MEHITVGRKHNEVKVAFAECVKNGSLKNIDIKGKCFLLIILLSGKLEFKVGNEKEPAVILLYELQPFYIISIIFSFPFLILFSIYLTFIDFAICVNFIFLSLIKLYI